MIRGFDYYLRKGDVKKKTSDPEEAKALTDKAERRFKRIKKEEINESNADLIFEDAYELIRESSQALMSLKGFKPYSHKATISFLRKFYKKEFSNYELKAFNRYRRKRNNAVYKGKKVTVEEAREIRKFGKKFLKKIKRLL